MQEAEVGFIYLNGKQPLTMDADTMQKVKSVPLAVFEVSAAFSRCIDHCARRLQYVTPWLLGTEQ